MLKTLNRLWKDEAGFVVSTELTIVATLLVIGLLVGIESLRISVLQELGDLANALAGLNQSYVLADTTGHTAATAGADYIDETDFCEGTQNLDVTADSPACIVIGAQTVSDEGGTVAAVDGAPNAGGSAAPTAD